MARTRLKVALVLCAVGVAFLGGLYFGVGERSQNIVSAQTATTTAPSNVDMSQFWQAYTLLNQNFVVTHASSSFPTTQQQIYGAIAGLTNSFGDPYTVFMPPTDATVFNQDISGSFDGVGMEMGVQNGELVVIAPLKGSPAETAGVRSGDAILAIDGTATDGLSVDDAIKAIRGPKGTTVKLTLSRQGVAQPLTISIVRDVINIPIINAYSRSDGIFVIELYSFSANSADLFRGALRQFFDSGDTKLLLDLRGNPGGYLDAAVQMASYFLPAGSTIVTEDYQGKQPNDVNRSLGYNVFADKKLTMAILVDQGSASAAEILSGALQQHGVAKLIGTRTFGKGSVQEVMDLGGGAQIKITIARWLTPNGTSISEGGLQPDIKVDRTDADIKAGKDPQKDAAIEYLTQN
jgi:carboxyl-terminal processing protease